MKTLLIAVLMASIAFPAIAGPKPIKGKYSCKGTATRTLEIGGIGGGYAQAKVKGKMIVSLSGWSELYVLNTGWQAAIADQYPTTYTPSFKTSSDYPGSRALKGMTRGCTIAYYSQAQDVTANRNGRKLVVRATQYYICRGADALEIDKYELTCKR